MQWGALLAGEVVGEALLDRPVVTFVDGGDAGPSQTGADGPWLRVLTDLLPFQLNRVTVREAAVRLRSERGAAPIDVHVSQISARLDDLSNIRESTAPLVTTLTAEGKVMDQARFELNLELDLTRYRPTFNLVFRMLDLEMTKVNDLARVYGGIDFEGGRFDLVVEAEADAGQIEGSLKPLFRNLEVHSFRGDTRLDDPLGGAWQLLVGIVGEVLENQPRDQVGTVVTFTADPARLQLDLIEIVGQVLRNLRNNPTDGMTFSAPTILQP